MSDNKPQWIWAYGDFEMYHHIKMSFQREARGRAELPIWKLYQPNPLVRLGLDVDLEEEEEVSVVFDGMGEWRIDGILLSAEEPIKLSAGHHFIELIVGNLNGIPAAFVEGKTIVSNGRWKADDMSGEYALPVGTFSLYDKNVKPTDYQLPCTKIQPKSVEKIPGGMIIDFGKETFVKLVLENFRPGASLKLCYGESLEEANDYINAPIRETIILDTGKSIRPARACRYIRIDTEEKGDVYALYEYLPLTMRGGFKCSDALINNIYNVSEYTLRLNCRLFIQDGIKRDRWVWSGDAYQSYFADYYSYFDLPLVERTMIALRGKDPLVKHINTIVDYSFYWIIAFKNHYLYTGDIQIIKNNYKNIVSLMEFCISRANSDGLIEGLKNDWVFIDWADMEKEGALCAMQMLYCRALQTAAECANMLNDGTNAERFSALAKSVEDKIYSLYWNSEKGAFVTTYKDGKPSEEVRRHANLFAVVFGFADENMTKQIVKNVIENDKVPQITTPYFKYYELEALCKIGKTSEAAERIRSYWGGMLDLGATTFWEEYKPYEHGKEHLAMYGNPYDKSLCHAWGASPIYLLGRYCLGIYPTEPGYKKFAVKPDLFGFGEISGVVPTPGGDISVEIKDNTVRITTSLCGGVYVSPKGEECEIIPNKINYFAF